MLTNFKKIYSNFLIKIYQKAKIQFFEKNVFFNRGYLEWITHAEDLDPEEERSSDTSKYMLIDWLVDWLINCFIDWLIDWLKY